MVLYRNYDMSKAFWRNEESTGQSASCSAIKGAQCRRKGIITRNGFGSDKDTRVVSMFALYCVEILTEEGRRSRVEGGLDRQRDVRDGESLAGTAVNCRVVLKSWLRVAVSTSTQ